jgi:hypothetical protein
MTRKIILASGAALALAVASNASAAITVYTDQASFLAAVSGAATDGFEDISIVNSTPSPLSRTVGSYGYTASVSTTSFFGAGSNADHWLSTNTATDTVTLQGFTGGVYGVGGNFFGSDIVGLFALGNVTLTATDADGTVSQTIVNANTASFLGFVSSSGVTSVTLASVQPANAFMWPSANNLILGGQADVTTAVPEPASWAMMIAGFGLIGSAMRRRRAVISFA